MTVSKRSDQIFQLSLTEIAFTIAFILLLLLGYLVARETTARQIAEEKLAKVQELEIAQQTLNEATSRLSQELLGAGIVNSQEIISNLVENSKLIEEKNRLSLKIKDLEAQVSSLSEIKQIAADAAEGAGRKTVADEVVSALVMQDEAKKAIASAKESQQTSSDKPQRELSPDEIRAEVQRSIEVMTAVEKALRDARAKPLPTGREAAEVTAMVRAAQSLRGFDEAGKGVESVIKENVDLRGQMANMRNKFTAIGRGLDHPPCWADEAGNIEYLFRVELEPGAFIVSPAWPDRRRVDAEQLQGVSELTNGPIGVERFRSGAQLIFNVSKSQDPQCRHYVRIKNNIETRREADQARWTVENFFYKSEIGR